MFFDVQASIISGLTKFDILKIDGSDWSVRFSVRFILLFLAVLLGIFISRLTELRVAVDRVN